MPGFDPVVFDEAGLAARGLVTGTAGAGRGGAIFFALDGAALVLRRYRRGGLARHLSRDRYLSRGAMRSRPMREFALLLELEALGLPAPRPFAARRTRHGPFESGALVTHRLPGRTLAERLAPPDVAPGAAPDVDDVPWATVGRCVAGFHRAGVLHADLNAHNVLVADAGDAPAASLIDFDRGRRLSGPVPAARARRHLDRLARSIDKVRAAAGVPADGDGIEALETAWRNHMEAR